MEFADAYSRATKYAAEDAWNYFRQRLTAEPTLRWGTHEKAAEERPPAADAYQEATGDEAGAKLLRDPTQHVVLDADGRVRKGRFTDHHLVQAAHDVDAHLDTWSGGDHWVPNIDFDHARGTSPADWEADENDFDDEEYHKPLPYGTVHVGDYDDNGYREPYHSFLPYSEVGPHLADVIGDDVNGADYGWNTDLADADADHDTPSLPGTVETNGDRFDRLLEALRNAPYEEVDGE